jgi:hypothetical protein
MSSLDRTSHITRIEEALAALLAIQTRTAAPAPFPHQVVGTILDNTACLLTAPANALDGGCRVVSFSEDRNWVSAMQAVHRSFFSSIQSAVELGLATICEEAGSVVEIARNRRITKLAHGLADKVDSTLIAGELRELERLRHSTPAFNDYLETALRVRQMPMAFKRTWRRYFDALSIVRNKASHSDWRLTIGEQRRLREQGFAVMVSPAGELQLNPRIYEQVAAHVLDFFDALCDGVPAVSVGEPGRNTVNRE